MQLSILSQEQGMAVLKISVPGETLTKALDDAYKVYTQNHPDFTVERSQVVTDPQAGDVLRQAVEEVFSDVYAQAVKESGLAVASEPLVSVLSVQEDTGVEYQMQFAVRPEVTLGQYKGLHVKCPATEPTEAEIAQALEAAQRANTTPKTVDRPAQLGDIATIDFTGYLDGVPFDGGAGTDYPLTLGSGTFIPGFEEQIVGAKVGDHVAVNVTFPENYQAENLAGKPTVFRVQVKKLEELEKTPLTPEQENEVRAQAAQQKKLQADQQIEDEVLGRILEEAQVEIPQAMLDSEVNICMQQFIAEIGAQGMDLEHYQQRIGKNTDQMLAEMAPLAKRRIMLRLVLSAIAKEEAMEATEEEIEAQWDQMAQQYGIDKPRLKVYAGDGAEEQIKADIVRSKAYALLRESTILDMA
jgi:trigger factor